MSDRSHSLPDRFHVPAPWPSDVVSIAGQEAHHLLHVMRKSKGDRIEIFDGAGRSAEAEIIEARRRDVEARIVSPPVDENTRSTGQVSIAVSPPKGERLKSMIEKLTEVGVDRIVLLETERTVVHPGETRVDKLEQTVIAACKQCRRNTLPTIIPAMPLADAVAACGSSAIWVADQHGSQASASATSPQDVCCFVGPEGGLTTGEMQQLSAAGASTVSLSPYVLRVETAAVLAAGWLIGRNRAE